MIQRLYILIFLLRNSVFRFPAAIAEMLVQSTGKDLYLLPALPRDKWGSGSAMGLRARGGLTVNIRWDGGLLHEVDVWSDHESTHLERLHYDGSSVAVSVTSPHIVHTFNGELRLVKTCRLSDMVAT